MGAGDDAVTAALGQMVVAQLHGELVSLEGQLHGAQLVGAGNDRVAFAWEQVVTDSHAAIWSGDAAVWEW